SPTPTGVVVVLSLTEQADGKLLVGGWFGSVNGQAHFDAVRLHADGNVDSSFNVTPNEAARQFIPLPDGKIIIRGAFSMVNGTQQPYLARLHADGSLDTTYNPQPDS